MTMTDPTAIKLSIDWPAKNKRENDRYERGQYADESTTCYCCGRKAGSHWVAIDMRSTSAVSNEYAQKNDADVAYFPIGPVCRKANELPNSHVLSRRKLWGVKA